MAKVYNARVQRKQANGAMTYLWHRDAAAAARDIGMRRVAIAARR